MNNQETHSLTARYSVIAVFALMLVSALSWLTLSSYSLVNQLFSDSSTIVFVKGSFYLAGICITLIALLYDFIYETTKKRSLPAKATYYVTRAGIAGVVIMLMLPHMIQYGVEEYVTSRGYSECEKASYQWLIYRKIVFTNNIDVCAGLTE